MADYPIPGVISESGEHPRLAEYVKEIKYFCLCRKGKLVNLNAPEVAKRDRTNQQNRYLRGLERLLSKHTGYTVDEIHDMLRGKFLFKMVKVGITEVKILISTADLDTVKMGDFTENIREWQREFLPEVYLPTADEWKRWEEAL